MGRGFLGLEQPVESWPPAVDVGVSENEPESIRKSNDRQLRILGRIGLVLLVLFVVIYIFVKLNTFESA